MSALLTHLGSVLTWQASRVARDRNHCPVIQDYTCHFAFSRLCLWLITTANCAPLDHTLTLCLSILLTTDCAAVTRVRPRTIIGHKNKFQSSIHIQIDDCALCAVLSSGHALSWRSLTPFTGPRSDPRWHQGRPALQSAPRCTGRTSPSSPSNSRDGAADTC